jgi:hypothetical protein
MHYPVLTQEQKDAAADHAAERERHAEAERTAERECAEERERAAQREHDASVAAAAMEEYIHNLERELEALRATKTFRAAAPFRRAYARLRTSGNHRRS